MKTRTPMCIPIEDWPEYDRIQWRKAIGDNELFGDLNVAATWRPRTQATVAEAYGYALAWLSKQMPIDNLEAPTLRWRPPLLRSYIEDLRGRVRPATVVNRVLNLERALAVVDPTGDRAHVKRTVRRLGTPPADPRKRGRLQNTADLVDLGFTLMRCAEDGFHSNTRKNAAVYRDGLQIALLAHCPLRRKNFTELEIGTQLRRSETGWWIILRGEETKTNQPVDIPFPEALVPALERYLKVFRPRLAADKYCGHRLWVTYLGTAQAPHSLQLSIARRTQDAFGQPVNPHLFRDCVATSIAIHDPENVRMAATILGHRSLATTERHYILATTLEAGRALANVLIARRRARPRR